MILCGGIWKERLQPLADLLNKKHIQSLLEWFSQNGVAYPWGDDPTPYKVWVSEVMLQQTVVTAAIEHFKRWMVLFPDIKILAEAEEDTVLKAWEGLGYYSRARNLRKGAIYLMKEKRGCLPASYKELTAVPGIGDYTARALLSLAWGLSYPVLDANVRRIGQRLLARSEWDKQEDKRLLEKLEQIIPADNPGGFNAALMQLGQQICRTGKPDCCSCPLQTACVAYGNGQEESIPVRKKRTVKEKHTVLFLILNQGRLLMVRRSSGIGRGLWFLPGVDKESAQAVRILVEEQAVEAGSLPASIHYYTCWKDCLYPEIYESRRMNAAFQDIFPIASGDRMEWIGLADLESCPSPSVYRRILNTYLKGLSDFQGRVLA